MNELVPTVCIKGGVFTGTTVTPKMALKYDTLKGRVCGVYAVRWVLDPAGTVGRPTAG